MKLCTYNFLTSKAIKGVKVGYPLILTINRQEEVENEYNQQFIERLIPKLDWQTILVSAEKVGKAEDLPSEQPANYVENEALLRKLHNLLLEIEILDGTLTCPETGRVFPIKDGIPNMLLNEHEI